MTLDDTTWSLALDAVVHPALVVESTGRVLFQNAAARDRFGSADRIQDLVAERSPLERALVECLRTNDACPFRFTAATDGQGCPASVRVLRRPSGTRDRDRAAICLVQVDAADAVRLRGERLRSELDHRGKVLRAVRRDVVRKQTALERMRERASRLSRLAREDELTGLGNRRGFDERLTVTHGLARSMALRFALVVFDVDDFKQINDSLGHTEGDRCLQEVAETLRSAVRRPKDQVFRLGGDEFAWILPDTDESGVRRLLQRLFEQLPVRSEESRCRVSAGAAVWKPTRGESTEEVFRRADEALYRAKRLGRGRFVVSEQSRDQGRSHSKGA